MRKKLEFKQNKPQFKLASANLKLLACNQLKFKKNILTYFRIKILFFLNQ
jgi:hypothetical protein